MSRFVLLTNSSNVFQQLRITNLIKAQGASWWHWFPQAWIIDDVSGRDHGQWFNLIHEAEKKFVFVLIDLENPDRAPGAYMNNEWYDWIRERWPDWPT